MSYAFPAVKAVLYSILLVVLILGLTNTSTLYSSEIKFYTPFGGSTLIEASVGVLSGEVCMAGNCVSLSCSATGVHRAAYIGGMVLLLITLSCAFVKCGSCTYRATQSVLDVITGIIFATAAIVVLAEFKSDECSIGNYQAPGVSIDSTLHFGFFVLCASALVPLIMSCVDCCVTPPGSPNVTTTVVTTQQPMVYAPAYVPADSMQAMQSINSDPRYVQPGGYVPPVQPGVPPQPHGYLPPAQPGGYVPPVQPAGCVPPVQPAGCVPAQPAGYVPAPVEPVVVEPGCAPAPSGGNISPVQIEEQVEAQPVDAKETQNPADIEIAM